MNSADRRYNWDRVRFLEKDMPRQERRADNEPNPWTRERLLGDVFTNSNELFQRMNALLAECKKRTVQS
jgi:hypothetical protein